jgi:hypothetical protein
MLNLRNVGLKNLRLCHAPALALRSQGEVRRWLLVHEGGLRSCRRQFIRQGKVFNQYKVLPVGSGSVAADRCVNHQQGLHDTASTSFGQYLRMSREVL